MKIKNILNTLRWLLSRSIAGKWLLVAFLCIALWYIDSQLINIVFATNTTPTPIDVHITNKVNEYISLANVLMQFIYLLLWPLLALAGLAIDNTLVYGGVFYMDAPLWVFWNMMKNFANFALGFLVLFNILKYIFSAGQGETPKQIITQTLIAGVLIQASWFILAAFIDISTIVTYAVGGMPITILKDQPLGQKQTLGFTAQLDLDRYQSIQTVNERNGMMFYYTTKDINGTIINLSPCKIEKQYIVGRQYGDTINTVNENQTTGGISFMKNVCVFEGNKLVLFANEIPYIQNTEDRLSDAQYQTALKNALQDTTDAKRSERQTQNVVFQIMDTESYCPPTRQNPQSHGIMSIENGSKQLNLQSPKISDIIDRAQGFQGPLMTLFASLLDFGSFAQQSKDVSTRGIMFESLIKVIFAFALIIPLLIFTIILFMRVGILWVMIASSPLYILSWMFNINALKALPFNDNRSSSIKVIFAPIIPVFALSIALIFMMVLKTGMLNCDATKTEINTRQNIEHALGIQTVSYPDNNTKGMRINDRNTQILVESKGDTVSGGLTTDLFGWIITNLFAIGIVRLLLMAALKATTIGGKVVEGLEKFSEKTIGNMTIIPIPVGEGKTARVGTKTAMNLPGQMSDQMMSNWGTQQERRINELFGTGNAEIDTKHVSNIAQSFTQSPDGLNEYLAKQNMAKNYKEQYSLVNTDFIKELSNKLGGDTARNNAATALKNTISTMSKDEANKILEGAKDTELIKAFYTLMDTQNPPLTLKDINGNPSGTWDKTNKKFA